MSKSTTAVFSFSVSIFLSIFKIAIAILSGSVSVIAEAINNTSDVVTSLVTLIAVRVSDIPADKSHPYGHGKIESLSALVTAGFLFAIYISVIREAINRLVEPRPIENGVLSLVVILIGLLVNLVRVTIISRAARKYHSQALAAESLNFRTDILSSSIVLVVVVLTLLSDGNPILQRADAIGAIAVSGVVLYFAFRLGKQAIDALLDKAPEALTESIRTAAKQVNGVVDVGAIRAREVGSQVFIELTASVSRAMSLEASHDVAAEVEEKVRNSLMENNPGVDVVVRINPVVQDHESLVDEIHAAAMRAGRAVHNISVHVIGREQYVQLDLEVDGHLNLLEAHDIATELEKSLMAQFSLAHVSVHIEPRNEPIEARAVSRQQATIDEVVRLARTDIRIQKVDHIVLDRVGSSLNISIDCQFEPTIPLSEAHLAAEQLERELRRHLPNLGQVLIHTEPEGT
ncbi:MAG TPA: cation diffusion facilitator family transporter [Anaerolineae bacterium]